MFCDAAILMIKLLQSNEDVGNGILQLLGGKVIISFQKTLIHWHGMMEGANGLEDMKTWRFAHVNMTMWPVLPVYKKAGEHVQRVRRVGEILHSVTKAANFCLISCVLSRAALGAFVNYFKAGFNCEDCLQTGLVSKEPPTQLLDRTCAPVMKVDRGRGSEPSCSPEELASSVVYERALVPMFWFKWKWEFSLLAWRRRRRRQGQRAFYASCILRSGWIKLNAAINFITGCCWQICSKCFVTKSLLRTRIDIKAEKEKNCTWPWKKVLSFLLGKKKDWFDLCFSNLFFLLLLCLCIIARGIRSCKLRAQWVSIHYLLFGEHGVMFLTWINEDIPVC